MEDSKQRVLWIARILDHFRLNIWNFRWRGEPETVRELEQQKLDFWNQLGPLQQQPELTWRHALTKLPTDNSAWPDVPGDGWLLENDRTPFLQELLFTFVAQTMWEAAALNKVRSADKQPVQSGQAMLLRILQFMRTRGMDQNMLPNVIHYDLVRPLSGIGTDLRRESRLDEADALQKAYLRLGMACRTQFPDDADVLLAISEAYLQAWKNNLRRDDAAAAVDALKLSLDAAKTATLVAPDSARARFQVADRIKRLTRFRPTESFSQKN
jgi:hypothetical protein